MRIRNPGARTVCEEAGGVGAQQQEAVAAQHEPPLKLRLKKEKKKDDKKIKWTEDTVDNEGEF
jgi:hypothetical protein